MGRYVAEWRFPSEKQAKAEKALRQISTAAGTPDLSPDSALPPHYWDAVLSDPRARGRPPIPIEQRRLSEIPRSVLRVECDKCIRLVEIQTADAIRRFGLHAVWKDAAMKMLESGCKARTGNRDDDGCWPHFRT